MQSQRGQRLPPFTATKFGVLGAIFPRRGGSRVERAVLHRVEPGRWPDLWGARPCRWRRIGAGIGRTPRRIPAQGVEAGQALLESSTGGVATIARHCGFGSEETMRRIYYAAVVGETGCGTTGFIAVDSVGSCRTGIGHARAGDTTAQSQRARFPFRARPRGVGRSASRRGLRRRTDVPDLCAARDRPRRNGQR